MTNKLEYVEASYSADCDGDIKVEWEDIRGMLQEIEDWRSDNERSGQHECS